MTSHTKPPGAKLPHSSQSELNWTQRLISLDDPQAVSEEEMKHRYPIEFTAPPVDQSFIKQVALHDDAEERVEEKAETAFDAANPIDRAGLETREDNLAAQIHANNQAANRAREEGDREPRFEEVAIRGSKYDHTEFFLKQMVILAFLIVSGVLVMGATLSNVILESDKVPLAYDYPAIVYLFAFIPVTMMFVIAQAWQWIRCERCKIAYTGALFILCLAVSAAWIATFGPAYSEAVEFGDLSAPAGFDFYPLHITLQLCGEILLGALVKIALFRMDRDSRKTEPRETASSKLSRASVNMLAIMNAPMRMELEAISRQLTAHKAAKKSFVSTSHAALRAEQAAMALLDERANAAAMQARLSLKDTQLPTNPLH